MNGFHYWRNRFLAWFFHLLYHSFAWVYDWFSGVVSVGLWRGWVNSAANWGNGSRILELGHGPGHLLFTLQKQGYWVCGLDASWQMSMLATKNAPNSPLINGYAQELPFSKYTFDQIISTFPAPYIFDAHTLCQIYRVLTPDGQLILLLGAKITGHSFPQRLAHLLFQITGQAQVPNIDDLKTPFVHAGFDVRIEIRPAQASQLFFLIADKKGKDNNISK